MKGMFVGLVRRSIFNEPISRSLFSFKFKLRGWGHIEQLQPPEPQVGLHGERPHRGISGKRQSSLTAQAFSY